MVLLQRLRHARASIHERTSMDTSMERHNLPKRHPRDLVLRLCHRDGLAGIQSYYMRIHHRPGHRVSNQPVHDITADMGRQIVDSAGRLESAARDGG